MKWFIRLIFVVFVSLFCSCKSDIAYDFRDDVFGHRWGAERYLTTVFSVPDNVGIYNIHLRLRVTESFDFYQIPARYIIYQDGMKIREGRLYLYTRSDEGELLGRPDGDLSVFDSLLFDNIYLAGGERYYIHFITELGVDIPGIVDYEVYIRKLV
ncbi:MAG: hypothetical protein C0594_16810 [Marinilabiliales bacterium]|nr:MAG: hypothetical protein C0594_16810 [Marinilabiliales bacterium]